MCIRDRTEAVCEGCGAALDESGRHRAACSESGRLKVRAGPMERTMARICREAGATVRSNVLIKNLNLPLSASDDRRIEVLAMGLPCRHGRQLAID
eukprot:10407800-Karenia_brevis.AAC.1